MNKRLALMTAAGIGAGAMYIPDPDRRGVQDVVNDLTIHKSANNISSLQGHPIARRE